MKNILHWPLGVAFVLTGLLTACNTGTESGATNVENGADKSLDPALRQSATVGADSATAGLQQDTAAGPTNRQQYERAGEATDHDRDGLAD